jgi:hypothetical protein
VSKYIEYADEPDLRPEFIERAKKIMKEKPIHVGTPDELRRMMGIK